MRGIYGNTELYAVPFAGGAEEKLADGVATIISWSADSKRVLYATRGLKEWNTIHVKTREVVHLLGGVQGDRIGSAYLAPDDRWLLFNDTAGSQGGGSTVTIAPMRDGALAGPNEWSSRSGARPPRKSPSASLRNWLPFAEAPPWSQDGPPRIRPR